MPAKLASSLETTIFRYDLQRFPFPDVIRNYLRTDRLDDLHSDLDLGVLTREKDQSTEFHRAYYDRFDHKFERIYERFLIDVVQPYIGEDIIYQRIPTFRIHLPGNIAVGEFHRDRDYSHADGEINFWVPMTRAWETNTVWIESSEEAADFRPYPLEVGEVLVFDGVNLAHGNKLNETGKTRVSFDFRVIPRSHYAPRTDVTINTGVKFEIGGYFAELESAPAGRVAPGSGKSEA
jgi:hypothetical protein